MSELKKPTEFDYMDMLDNVGKQPTQQKNRVGISEKIKIKPTITKPVLKESSKEELVIRKGLMEDYEIASKTEAEDKPSIVSQLMTEYEEVSGKKKMVKESKSWKSMIMTSIPDEYISELGTDLYKLDDLFVEYEQIWDRCNRNIFAWIKTTGQKYAEKGYNISGGYAKAKTNEKIVSSIKDFYKFLEIYISRNLETINDKNLLEIVKKINKSVL